MNSNANRSPFAGKEIDVDHAPVVQTDDTRLDWVSKIFDIRVKFDKPIIATDVKVERLTPKSEALLKLEQRARDEVKRRNKQKRKATVDADGLG